MRLSGVWVLVAVGYAGCGGSDSTTAGPPISDSGATPGSGGTANGAGGSNGARGGAAGVTGGTDGGAAGTIGGQGGKPGQHDASTEGGTAKAAAADGTLPTGTCSGSADCNGATCCGAGDNSRMCVASPAQCVGLVYCKLPADCPNMDHCCPQGFCGGCD